MTEQGTIHNNARNTENNSRLTKRECEVLALLASGMRNMDIADSLYISENTVETHLKNIYNKANIKNRVKAAEYYHRTVRFGEKIPESRDA